MNKTTNLVQLFHQEIAELPQRKSLLFHACCGVCCVYPLLLLDDYFDITIYYTNSNIYPASEYDHRLSELERYLKIIQHRFIQLVVPPRQTKEFIEKLSPYAREKEGGARCRICYDMRLQEAFAYAAQEGYDYCGTVMSVSSHKNAALLHEIGKELEAKYKPVRFLSADFKKEGGQQINNQLNRLVGLYHQNYCGCPFSLYATYATKKH